MNLNWKRRTIDDDEEGGRGYLFVVDFVSKLFVSLAYQTLYCNYLFSRVHQKKETSRNVESAPRKLPSFLDIPEENDDA